MSTVYRYEIDIVDSPTVSMPMYAEILSVGVHKNTSQDCISLWAKCDPRHRMETRRFLVRGTAHPLPGGSLDYIGTVIDERYGTDLVWHVFEEVT